MHGQHTHAQVTQAISGEMPLHSLEGDVYMVLDDGTKITAHSLYLEQASLVFRDALACAYKGNGISGEDEASLQKPTVKPNKTMLPLMDVTQRQVQLLVTCLYSWNRETWLGNLKVPELIELGRVAHRFACSAVLESVDRFLVEKCGVDASLKQNVEPEVWLTVADIPAEFRLAQQLQLAAYEDLVGRFMGKHAHAVDTCMLDSGLAAVLNGASLR